MVLLDVWHTLKARYLVSVPPQTQMCASIYPRDGCGLGCVWALVTSTLLVPRMTDCSLYPHTILR